MWVLFKGKFCTHPNATLKAFALHAPVVVVCTKEKPEQSDVDGKYVVVMTSATRNTIDATARAANVGSVHWALDLPALEMEQDAPTDETEKKVPPPSNSKSTRTNVDCVAPLVMLTKLTEGDEITCTVRELHMLSHVSDEGTGIMGTTVVSRSTRKLFPISATGRHRPRGNSTAGRTATVHDGSPKGPPCTKPGTEPGV